MEQLSFRMQLAGQCKSASMVDTARRSFTSFLQESDIRLSLINAPLIKQYESFLLRKNLALNTVSCYMRILRSVYNKAVEEGLSPQRVPFKKVYTGIAKTNKRSVDENVMQRLQKFDLTKFPKLAFARDLFMLSFYTRGMSFIDMANLTSGNLQNGYLFYARSKTGGLLSIKVEPCIEEIIERHKVFAVAPYLLPIRSANHPDYSNRLRVYNKRLKRISLLMGLERPLSSYAARHSWATIALRRGVSIRVISESMGHADESTTRIYLASLGQDTLDEANERVIQSFF
jgi:site-specific recombinase XerD